jgi:hypothetical protein
MRVDLSVFNADWIDFESETHTYRDKDGLRLMSVSEVLTATGVSPKEDYPPWAADRGRKVHKLTELYDMDDLELDSVDPELSGYLASWIKLRGDHYDLYDIVGIEVIVGDPTMRVAGTIDRVLRNRETGLLAVGEIKSGAYKKWHQVQTELYLNLLNFRMPMSNERVHYYLDKGGDPPKPRIYEDDNDIGYCAARTARWIKKL